MFSMAVRPGHLAGVVTRVSSAQAISAMRGILPSVEICSISWAIAGRDDFSRVSFERDTQKQRLVKSHSQRGSQIQALQS